MAGELSFPKMQQLPGQLIGLVVECPDSSFEGEALSAVVGVGYSVQRGAPLMRVSVHSHFIKYMQDGLLLDG